MRRTMFLTAIASAAILLASSPTALFAASDEPASVAAFLAEGPLGGGDRAAGERGLYAESLRSTAEDDAAAEAEGPEETTPASGDGAERPSERYLGGGLSLNLSVSDLDWVTFGGFGFFGAGLLTADLLPGKSFPFPAVFLVDLEFIYFPAESGITDIHFTAHGAFGVDVLFKVEKLRLFPYVGVGIGFEAVSGTYDTPFGGIDADDTAVIFPWDVGVGFVFDVTASLAFYARTGISIVANASNIGSFWRLQAGLLLKI